MITDQETTTHHPSWSSQFDQSDKLNNYTNFESESWTLLSLLLVGWLWWSQTSIFSLEMVATNHTSHQRPMCRPRHCRSTSWYQRNLRYWSPSLNTLLKVNIDYEGLPICHRRNYLITFPASGNRTNLPSTVNSTLLTSVWGRKEER